MSSEHEKWAELAPQWLATLLDFWEWTDFHPDEIPAGRERERIIMEYLGVDLERFDGETAQTISRQIDEAPVP